MPSNLLRNDEDKAGQYGDVQNYLKFSEEWVRKQTGVIIKDINFTS